MENKFTLVDCLPDDEKQIKRELEALEREERELEEQLAKRETLKQKKENLRTTLQKLEEKKTPYERGSEAFWVGKGLDEHPFQNTHAWTEGIAQWTQGWVDAKIEESIATQTLDLPSSLDSRLKALEDRKPIVQSSELTDETVNKKIKKIQEHADAQIRRARRYILTIALVAFVAFWGILGIVHLAESGDEGVANKAVEVQEVQEVQEATE